jgi:serine/threonine protein kinase
MEGADTTAENLMLDMRKSGKSFPREELKRIGISLLHMHEHGIIHGDFGTHNIGKFGSRWKLLGIGGSVPIGSPTDPDRGFYRPPESFAVENNQAHSISITAQETYDIWAYGVVVYEAVAGAPLTFLEEHSVVVALQGIQDEVAQIQDEVAQGLLRQLLHPDPKQRMSSMKSVIDHPFFGSE